MVQPLPTDHDRGILFSVITPSKGDRPKALLNAVTSVQAAILGAEADISCDQVEMLIGFDGVKGERVSDLPFVRYYDFPYEGNYGNAIRQGLLKAARGARVLFVDDDNALTPIAFRSYAAHPEPNMLIARIDTSITMDVAYLPQNPDSEDVIRHGNIDPLCVCLDRKFVLTRCKGWQSEGRYESDYLNIRRYAKRAQTVKFIENVVGIYDAGLGLDEDAITEVQRYRLLRKMGKVVEPPPRI